MRQEDECWHYSRGPKLYLLHRSRGSNVMQVTYCKHYDKRRDVLVACKYRRADTLREECHCALAGVVGYDADTNRVIRILRTDM